MKGALESIAAQIIGEEDKGGTLRSNLARWKEKGEILEPRSVLYHRKSISPPTSTCTWSSSLSGCGDSSHNVQVATSQWKQEWAAELLPLAGSPDMADLDEREKKMLSASVSSPIQDHAFLRWIMGDIDGLSSSSNLHPPFFSPSSFVDPLFRFEPIEDNFHQFSSPNFLFQTNIKNPSFLLPVSPFVEVASYSDESTSAMSLEQHQSLIDQLFKVAEFVDAGNFAGAEGILARLNHVSSPVGKPLLRSSFYFKEALQVLVSTYSNPLLQHKTPLTTSLSSPSDVVLKLSAFKDFSEGSPVLHFTNFTVTQALLEELGTASRIHIIDFDIGIGGQWASFLQELARRRSPFTPAVKITALVSFPAFHPLELSLIYENLSQFAAHLCVPFEINISNIEFFDPVDVLTTSSNTGEVIAVNLPTGPWLTPSSPLILRLFKQLAPKIIVSVDHGPDRSNLPFSGQLLHALQSSLVLLDSIDAMGSNVGMTSKVERFILQPIIHNSIMKCYHSSILKAPPWPAVFSSAGFSPVKFSNFTETQAECLIKKFPVRGFHVEKRQASICLYWQKGELVSVSAWRC